MAGQLLFLALSPGFTQVRYEGRIYATIGAGHENEDLHKLNEAAHYFGQTVIGWTKFPHFNGRAIQATGLPKDVQITAQLQERQNIIFRTGSPTSSIGESQLAELTNFLQKEMDGYNTLNGTRFVLSNMDYETLTLKKSYGFGAAVALLASGVLWLGLLFVRQEFFLKPKS